MSHVCTICGKAYTQSGSLKRHVSVAHQNNMFECNSCHKKLTSKFNLERHRKLKHGLDNNKTDFRQFEYVPYVKNERELNDSDDIINSSKEEEKQLDNNNKEGVYSWVEQNNNEEIDNSKSKNKEIIVEENNDNTSINKDKMKNTSDSEWIEDDIEYKYNSFDIIDTPEEMRRRFEVCDKVVTFRVKPPTGKYTTWMLELIYDLYDYFIRTYNHDENDSVGLKLICKNGHCEQKYNITPKVTKNLNFGGVVREVIHSPFSCCGELTVCYDHILKPNPPPQITKKYGGRYKRLRYKPLIGGIMGRHLR